MYACARASPLNFFNQGNDFHKIWYECYMPVEDTPNSEFYTILQSVTIARRMHKPAILKRL